MEIVVEGEACWSDFEEERALPLHNFTNKPRAKKADHYNNNNLKGAFI